MGRNYDQVEILSGAVQASQLGCSLADDDVSVLLPVDAFVDVFFVAVEVDSDEEFDLFLLLEVDLGRSGLLGVIVCEEIVEDYLVVVEVEVDVVEDVFWSHVLFLGRKLGILEKLKFCRMGGFLGLG